MMNHSRSTIAWAVLAAGMTLGAFAGDVSETVGVGITGDTAGGCDLPDVSLSYTRDADGVFDTHGRVKVGGNRACRTAVSADIGTRRDFGPVSVDVGYVQRGVSFVGPSTDGVDDVFYGSMSAVSAAISGDVGPLSIGWDLPAEAPRVAAHFELPASIAVEVNSTRYPSRGIVTHGRVSHATVIGEQWGIAVYADVSYGIGNAPDPVSWISDSGRVPADPPDYSYAYGVEFTRRIQ